MTADETAFSSSWMEARKSGEMKREIRKEKAREREVVQSLIIRNSRMSREFRKSPGFSRVTGASFVAARLHVFDARLTAATAAVKWFRTLRSAARGGQQSGNVSTRRRTVCRAAVWVCRLIWQQAHADCAELCKWLVPWFTSPVRFIDLTRPLPKNKPVRSAGRDAFVNSRWVEIATLMSNGSPVRISDNLWHLCCGRGRKKNLQGVWK